MTYVEFDRFDYNVCVSVSRACRTLQALFCGCEAHDSFDYIIDGFV